MGQAEQTKQTEPTHGTNKLERHLNASTTKTKPKERPTLFRGLRFGRPQLPKPIWSYISPQVQTQPHPRPSARCICQYFGPELQGRRIGGPVNQRAEGLEGCRQTNMLKITN
uniref:HDC01534 n=1 Tax=Drosophila melanogaster TaxID=7227 RepID=Q6IHQ9_DROME|nr:TPA_inf: HDC01534 [Drosophila melanogaster]